MICVTVRWEEMEERLIACTSSGIPTGYIHTILHFLQFIDALEKRGIFVLRPLAAGGMMWGHQILTLIVPRAWDISFMHPCINCQGKSATHFVYFWSRKTLPYTHLEAISCIPQQGQSLHIWNTCLSTTACYKNKYTIKFLKLACMSRFATAISSSETELALGTIRVKDAVVERVSVEPSTSTRAVAHAMNISHQSIWRVLREYNLHSYHLQKVQVIGPQDFVPRMNFV